jgi:hypothetical protein
VKILDSQGALAAQSVSVTLSAYLDSSCTTAAGGFFQSQSEVSISGQARFQNLTYAYSGTAPRAIERIYLKAFSSGLPSHCFATPIKIMNYPSYVMFPFANPSPVAYWRLNEAPGNSVATNIADGASNAVFSGSYILGELGPLFYSGLTSNALHALTSSVLFTNGYASAPSSTKLNITTQAISIEAWIKPSSIPGSPVGIVSKWGAAAADQQYSLLLTSSGAMVKAMVGPGGVTLVSAPASGTALSAGNWYHVVGVIQLMGTNAQATIYVNGVSGSSNTTPISHTYFSTTSSSLLIGGQPSYFQGNVAEVAIYDRALGSQEIYDHYRAGWSAIFPGD